MSARSPSSPCRRGCVTGVHGGSRRSAKPGSLYDLPQVARGPAGRRRRRPGASSTSSASMQLLAQLGVHARARPRRARPRRSAGGAARPRRRRSRSSASSETSKSASRVTRKKPWSTISMPGNSASRLRGDDLLERDERRRRSSSSATKRGSISFGTFTRANVGVSRDRVAHEHGEGQRQVRDVRERAAEADGQRREDREDLAAEALGQRAGAARSETSSMPTMRMPCSASAGSSSLSTAARHWRSLQGRARARGSRRCVSRRRAAVELAASSRPASTWSCRPATRIMKNSSRLELKIAANFTRSSSGWPASSASCRTRSLKSSHDSSRLKYSSWVVEVGLRLGRRRRRRLDRADRLLRELRFGVHGVCHADGRACGGTAAVTIV